jgi:hypothetical protein
VQISERWRESEPLHGGEGPDGVEWEARTGVRAEQQREQVPRERGGGEVGQQGAQQREEPRARQRAGEDEERLGKVREPRQCGGEEEEPERGAGRLRQRRRTPAAAAGVRRASNPRSGARRSCCGPRESLSTRQSAPTRCGSGSTGPGRGGSASFSGGAAEHRPHGSRQRGAAEANVLAADRIARTPDETGGGEEQIRQ